MKKSKRIIIFEPCYDGYGGYHRAYAISVELVKQGNSVTLVSPARKTWTFTFKIFTDKSGVCHIRLPQLSSNFFFNGKFLRGLIALFICQKSYDVYYCFSIVQPDSLLPFIFLRFLTRKRVIIDWDDYWSGVHVILPHYNKYYGFLRKYFKFIEYRVQRLAKECTVTSKFLENKAKDFGILSVYKLINGIRVGEYQVFDKKVARNNLGIAPKDIIVLTLGNTFFGGRTANLIEYANALYCLSPSIKVYINIDPKKIIQENLVSDIEIDVPKNLVNVGYLTGSNLAAFISAADSLLFISGENDYESACFPIRIGTYLNASKPIFFISQDTETADVLENSGYGFSGTTPLELAKITFNMLVEPNELKFGGDVSKYAWGNLIKNFNDNFLDKV